MERQLNTDFLGIYHGTGKSSSAMDLLRYFENMQKDVSGVDIGEPMGAEIIVEEEKPKKKNMREDTRKMLDRKRHW